MQAEGRERLAQSMERVNHWVERERGNVAEAFKAQAHRQEAERAELEKKIEQAQKIGYWREDSPERAAQQRVEPGEQREQGRGRERY